MSHTRKTNRDHAKKSQRPMVEDEVVATQLEALVTPAITFEGKLLPPTGVERPDTEPTVDGGGAADAKSGEMWQESES